MSTKKEELEDEIRWLTNDLRIATNLARLKQEQATTAEERVVDITVKLNAKVSSLALMNAGGNEKGQT